MSRSRKGPPHNAPSRRDRGSPIRLAAIGGIIVIGISLVWVSKLPKAPPATRENPPLHPNVSTLEDDRTVFARYGGSASCRDCHKEAFDLWQHSHHGLAERPVQPERDRAAFDPPRAFQHGTQSSEASWTNGQARIAAIGLSGKPETLPVVRVIGEDPVRQFLVEFPGGRLQTLEASWDPRSNTWFNVYGAEDRRPGEWGHWTGRGMNWNNMCAGCHNTRVRKNYDMATDTYHTTMAEPTVSCESCHGPLQAHNDWQKKFGGSKQKDPTVAKFTRSQVTDNCGFCHARRGDLTGDFKPGDAFSDHQRLTLVDDTETFYADGQVREEDYEYAAFLGSRMHLRGVDCLDCHDAHSMRTRLPGNLLCLRCHDGSVTNAPRIDPVAHSRHKVFGFDASGLRAGMDLTAYKPDRIRETGGECVNCHMPQTVYMQRHSRHDHGFSSPDPLLTKQLGIPNACNRCHQDKDADWALKHCDDWYGAKMNRPSRHRAQTIAAARNGEPSAGGPLLEMFGREEIPYWRAAAAGLLASWAGHPAVRAALLSGLADTNALVRAECIRALDPLVGANLPDVAAAVQGRLDDPVRAVRIAAAWALRATIDPGSKAGSELLHSFRINADQPAGRMQNGAFALARGDAAQAVTHYQKALEWDTNSAAIRHDYAVVLSELNRAPEAIEQLEAACRIEPRNAEFRYKLALAWNEAGRMEKTVEALEAAVQLDSRHARAWYNLGLARNSLGQTDSAIAALLQAEAAAPGDPRIPYARATILSGVGRTREAAAAARRALEIDPSYPEARQLLQRLPP